jgi:hypothetical protein
MALALSKTPVHRGRAEDNYEGAGTDVARVMVEPAPTPRDMAIAGETIAQQSNLSHRLMSKMVMVTLDQPYLGDPHATVVLTYGYGEATPVGPDTYRDEGAGSEPVPASDRLFTQGLGIAPRWVPGKPQHWHLRYEEGPLGNCACGMDPEMIVGRESVMPGPVARHWFGDWDVVAYELQAKPGQALDNWLTRSWHRDRVADENWGGYERDFPPGVPVYDNRGAVNVRALRRFGPPKVPHVTIARLDTMMRRLPNTAAKPWEIFKWEDACDKGPRMHFFDNHLETGTLSVTQADLNKMIAQGVAAALAAERVATKKGQTA